MSRTRRPRAFIVVTVTIGIVGILTAIALPQLLGARSKERNRECDSIFHALAGELANDLDRVCSGEQWRECNKANGKRVIESVVGRHQEERNPRNRRQPAFTTGKPETCQVQYYVAPNGCVTYYQDPGGGWLHPRSFGCTIEE